MEDKEIKPFFPYEQRIVELKIPKNTTAKMSLIISKSQDNCITEMIKGLNENEALNRIELHITSLEEKIYELKTRVNQSNRRKGMLLSNLSDDERDKRRKWQSENKDKIEKVEKVETKSRRSSLEKSRDEMLKTLTKAVGEVQAEVIIKGMPVFKSLYTGV